MKILNGLKLNLNAHVNKSDEDLMQLMMKEDSAANDLQQEIFYKVIKYKMSFKFESKFKTWLWGITKNTITDFYRSNEHKMKSRFEELTDLDGEEAYSTDIESMEELILKKSNKEMLNACMNELEGNYKDALLMAVHSELSNNEISIIMGISLASVKTLIFRAKNKILTCFSNGGHV